MAEAPTALELAKALTWGTYGPGAVEAYNTQGTPLPPMVFKTLGELDTDHLEAIIEHVGGYGTPIPGSYSAPAHELIVVAVKVVLEDRLA